MTVPHRSPTVPGERSNDRSPVPHPLGERERGTLPRGCHRSPSSTGVEAKAARLLAGGSVAIREVCVGRVLARVEGDHGTYDVTHDGRRWRCTCRSPGVCSHALAVARVVAVRAGIEHKVVTG